MNFTFCQNFDKDHECILYFSWIKGSRPDALARAPPAFSFIILCSTLETIKKSLIIYYIFFSTGFAVLKPNDRLHSNDKWYILLKHPVCLHIRVKVCHSVCVSLQRWILNCVKERYQMKLLDSPVEIRGYREIVGTVRFFCRFCFHKVSKAILAR